MRQHLISTNTSATLCWSIPHWPSQYEVAPSQRGSFSGGGGRILGSFIYEQILFSKAWWRPSGLRTRMSGTYELKCTTYLSIGLPPFPSHKRILQDDMQGSKYISEDSVTGIDCISCPSTLRVTALTTLYVYLIIKLSNCSNTLSSVQVWQEKQLLRLWITM